jgi:hypothetical protein
VVEGPDGDLYVLSVCVCVCVCVCVSERHRKGKH